jgi:hypothetical protein
MKDLPIILQDVYDNDGGKDSGTAVSLHLIPTAYKRIIMVNAIFYVKF